MASNGGHSANSCSTHPNPYFAASCTPAGDNALVATTIGKTDKANSLFARYLEVWGKAFRIRPRDFGGRIMLHFIANAG